MCKAKCLTCSIPSLFIIYPYWITSNGAQDFFLTLHLEIIPDRMEGPYGDRSHARQASYPYIVSHTSCLYFTHAINFESESRYSM